MRSRFTFHCLSQLCLASMSEFFVKSLVALHHDLMRIITSHYIDGKTQQQLENRQLFSSQSMLRSLLLGLQQLLTQHTSVSSFVKWRR